MASSEPHSELESTTTAGEPSSSFSTTFDTTSSSRLNATRMELERRQLHHTIQILKLELSQKQLLMDSLQSEHTSKVEELQEQLADAECEKKLLCHRLQALTQMHEEEVRQYQLWRDSQAPGPEYSSQPSCYEEAGDDNKVRQALQLSLATEEEYLEIQSKGAAMTLSDYARVRVYEIVRPFMKDTANLRENLNRLIAQLEESDKQRKKLQEEASRAEQLQQQCTELRSEVVSLSGLVQQSNFKTTHYSTLKSERDEMEKELDTVRRAFVEKEVRQSVIVDERDRWKIELTAVEQKIALLNQDKDYLTHQLSDQRQHLQMAQEQASHLKHSLDEVRHTKEELYCQFSKTREDLKKDYDTQLHHELEALRQRTHLEIEQLKLHTREVYEQEIRTLREARDGACAERERMLARHKELDEKHTQLVTEHQRVTMDLNSTVSDLQSALKMKTFDYERSQLLHQEAVNNLQHCQLEKDKALRKSELLSQELASSKQEREVRVQLLEERLRDMGLRVDGYEKLEKELDDVVMQAAEMDSGPDAERVLLSYGFGTSIPSSSRRRMQQSVHLARRVLKLERINSSLRQQIAAAEHSSEEQEEKLSSLAEQLDLSKQPYKYLVESLKGKDEELRVARDHLAALQDKVQRLDEERRKMAEVKDQLSSDLETLLNHREEMSIMKQLVVGLQGQGHMTMPHPAPPLLAAPTVPQIVNPKPTVFTKKTPLSWYKTPHAKFNHSP